MKAKKTQYALTKGRLRKERLLLMRLFIGMELLLITLSQEAVNQEMKGLTFMDRVPRVIITLTEMAWIPFHY